MKKKEPSEKFDKKQMPKNVSKKIGKIILKNFLATISIVLYFYIMFLAKINLQDVRFFGDIKVFSGTFLILGIIFLEQAYKRDDGYKALYGIEMLVLSAHTLCMMYVINKYHFDFQTYLLISSGVVGIYFLFKTAFIYTIEQKKYLDKFNDISEIVKDEPVKKEARKRNTASNKNSTKTPSKSAKKSNTSKSKNGEKK